MDDDDFGADQDFLAALAASETTTVRSNNHNKTDNNTSAAGPSRPRPAIPGPSRLQQPVPQKIQQPTPQRLDRAPPPQPNNAGPGVKQPTPQALPQRSAGSSILVSPRQKGNPVLACLKSMPWEYSDIPADYGLGQTTCALFLSLKYHRLHPEYIYTRIRNLQGRYNLRVLLAMVDIPNHEEPLRELSKTSLVNGVTLVLCWSAAEAARYLELYKSYEHAGGAGFAAIRGARASTYAERLVGFVTAPRPVNRADAVALVSTFGSLRHAVNADPETVGVVGGWGEKKVKAWCAAVEEPFRVRTAAKRRLDDDGGGDYGEEGRGRGRRNLDEAVPLGLVPLREMAGVAASRSQADGSASASARASVSRSDSVTGGGGGGGGQQQQANRARQFQVAGEDDDDDDEDAELAAAIEESRRMAEEEARARALGGTVAAAETASSSKTQEELTDGVAAALARLRKS